MVHIATFTRSTPDTAARVWVNEAGGVTWGDVATVVNPWDEYSLEETIAQAKACGGNSTVIAIGGEIHNDALKHSMAMGIQNAVRVEAAGAEMNDSIVWSALAEPARCANLTMSIWSSSARRASMSAPISIPTSWRGAWAGRCSVSSQTLFRSITTTARSSVERSVDKRQATRKRASCQLSFQS